MSYTVNVLLRPEKKDKDGLCPVAICVTVNRKRAYKHTGFKLLPKQWGHGKVLSSVPNAVLHNARLKKHAAEVEAALLNIELSGSEVTFLFFSSLIAVRNRSNILFSIYIKI